MNMNTAKTPATKNDAGVHFVHLDNDTWPLEAVYHSQVRSHANFFHVYTLEPDFKVSIHEAAATAQTVFE